MATLTGPRRATLTGTKVKKKKRSKTYVHDASCADLSIKPDPDNPAILTATCGNKKHPRPKKNRKVDI